MNLTQEQLQKIRHALLFNVIPLDKVEHGEALDILDKTVNSEELPSLEAEDEQFDYHFRKHIDHYADKFPALLVRQLARRLRVAWEQADIYQWIKDNQAQAEIHALLKRWPENWDAAIRDMMKKQEQK